MQPVAGPLRKVTEKAFIKRGRLFAKVMTGWARLLPAELAARSWPVRISSRKLGGKASTRLHIWSEDIAVSLALTYKADLLLEQMSLHFNKKIADEILVKTLGRSAPE